MANSFWNNIRTFLPASLARGDAVDNDMDGIAAGFDLVEAETGRAIKLPAGTASEIIESAGGRASKIIGFDGAGNLVILTPAGIGATLPSIIAGDYGKHISVNVAEDGFELVATEGRAMRSFFGSL